MHENEVSFGVQFQIWIKGGWKRGVSEVKVPDEKCQLEMVCNEDISEYFPSSGCKENVLRGNVVKWQWHCCPDKWSSNDKWINIQRPGQQLHHSPSAQLWDCEVVRFDGETFKWEDIQSFMISDRLCKYKSFLCHFLLIQIYTILFFLYYVTL